jgi:elongation factor G
MSAVSHVLSVVLDARDPAAAARLRAALETLCARDPALGLESGADNDFGLKGVSEAQLEWVVLHLQHQPDLLFKASRPQVLYRETVTRGCDWSYTHKQRDPAQYAKLHIALTPLARGLGIETELACPSEDLPPHIALPDLQHAIDTGIHAACQAGVVAGFPMTDLRALVFDLAWHDLDSTPAAFEIAARMGVHQALTKAQPWLLEPVMIVAALTPEEFLGVVIADLNSRRGAVQGLATHGAVCAVTAAVPLGRALGYENALRALTRGRGACTMAFDRYEQAPPNGAREDTFPMAAALQA